MRLCVVARAVDWLGLLRWRRVGVVSALFSVEARESYMAIVIVSYK